MRLLLPFLLILVASPARATHLDLDVSLDPTTRRLAVRAVLDLDDPVAGVALAPGLEVTKAQLDGRALRLPAPRMERGLAVYALPAAGRDARLELHYAGRLAPLAGLDHRQVLGRQPAMADPQGSFLPAGSGWYPDAGVKFSYRVRLALPPGQKGLVPGNPLAESQDRNGYAAAYDFPHPAEGIDLMAGPYATAERALALPGGGNVRVRTWFHPELAGLAEAYLGDSARYLERYSQLIGDYPFTQFSVVSSPLPTGFGMPSLAYLGREVLRLPFIRATSLGHEVLHNWWGNGVYPDWDRGNWSEGLTTFLADYAYKEDESAAAARDLRLAWLRDLAAVPESEDTPLKDFVSRHHGISSIVGYNKAAMVFFMLRDLIGRPAFERGLGLLWQRKRFRTASWADLEQAFADAAGRDLSGFFHQWVERSGAPRIALRRAEQLAGGLTVEAEQTGDYSLRLPLRLLVYPAGTEDRAMDLAGPTATARFAVKGLVQGAPVTKSVNCVIVKDPALFPAILREVFAAPRPALVLGASGADFQAAARGLAAGVLDAPPTEVRGDAPLTEGALLVISPQAQAEALLERLSLPPVPAAPGERGTTRVWAGRDAGGRPYAVVVARDGAALAALRRGLPHYGRQSWLVFEGGRVADKGVWPPRPERTRVVQHGLPAKP